MAKPILCCPTKVYPQAQAQAGCSGVGGPLPGCRSTWGPACLPPRQLGQAELLVVSRTDTPAHPKCSGSDSKAAQWPDAAPPRGKGERGVQLLAAWLGRIRPAGALRSMSERQGCQRGTGSSHACLPGLAAALGLRAQGMELSGISLPEMAVRSRPDPARLHWEVDERVPAWRQQDRADAHGRALVPGGNEPRAAGDSSDCQLKSSNHCASQIFLKRDPDSAPPGKAMSTSWFPGLRL